MKQLISKLHVIAITVVLGATASMAPTDVWASGGGWRVPGTYYLALDAEPFGLPPGLSLPGMLTLHGDRTAIIVDGGDFGGLPFDARDTAQLGSWRYSWEGVQVVLLFLTADGATGDVRSWQRVHITLRQTGRRTMEGEVNVFQLPCDGPAPFPIFNCPDPIENADAFTPASPPDVPVTLKRLSARTPMP